MRADIWRTARGLLRPWWVGLGYGIVTALPLAAWATGCPAAWLASVVGWANSYGILVVCAAVMVRLEEPRARLMPRYRHTHLAAGRLLVLAPLVLGSAIVYLGMDSRAASATHVAKAWAITAVFCCYMAIGLLAVLRRFLRAAGVGALLAIYLYLLLHLLGPDRGVVATLLRGGPALLAIAGLEWYVRSWTEEDFETARRWLSGNRDGWSWDGTSRLQSADVEQRIARRFPAGNGTAVLLVRLRGATQCSPWWLTLAGAVAGLAGVASLVLRGSDLLPSAGRLLASAPFAMVFCMLTVILPPMGATNQVVQWSLCDERIALWPVSRRRLIGGIAATIALQTLIVWGSLAAAAAVVLLLFEPEMLQTAWPWQLAAYSFALVVCLSGLGAWGVRHWRATPTPTATALTGGAVPLAAIALASGPLAFCGPLPKQATAADMMDAMPWAVLAAGYLALGLAASYAAWRSWMRGG
jgi:hypothetical protein